MILTINKTRSRKMIKRIIFDLDNTLIMWKDEYEKAADIAGCEFHVCLNGFRSQLFWERNGIKLRITYSQQFI